MSRSIIQLALALAAIVPVTRPILAQGTLSTQGLGFPPGQLSTGAITMGGATGENDPYSPLNPAAIRLLPAAILVFQAAPEFRSTRVGTQTLRTSVARFPLFVGTLPLGRRWTIGAAASTLLDRTWETNTRDTQVVNGETIASGIRKTSDGSIADVRLALGFALTSWLRVGVAGHAISGRDLVRDLRTFDDTARFEADTQETRIGFGGNAVSLGAQAIWARRGGIGIAYRRGGAMSAEADSVNVGRASVPDHFGVSVLYLGLTGVTVAARASRDSWSRLEGLAGTLNVHEAWDVGAGAEFTGPQLLGSPVALRAGGRWRTLPFSPGASPIEENTWSAGFGFPLARGGAELSIGALRSKRTGASATGTELSETAWTFSTGFAVRP
jgi:hypothetical protein